MKKIPKILLKILIWLLIVVVLVVGLIIGGTVLLKDKLIQHGVQAINEELTAPVRVDKIKFSLVNSFPYASIVLDNVTVMSPEVGFSHKGFSHTTADTLLNVRKLVLSFNMRKLLDNELELQSIKVSDGQFFVLIDDKGNDNFHILKQKKESASSAKMRIELKHLGFNDCAFMISNRYKGNGTGLYLPDFAINGEFDDGGISLQTKGAMTLQWFVANKMEIVPLEPTNIKMELSYRNDSLKVTEGRLSSRGIDVALSGLVLLKNDTYVNLQLKGRKISVANALQYFTLATHEKPKVQSTGSVDFSAAVRGKFDKRSTPLVTARFGLDNAVIKYPDLDIVLNNTNMKGSFSNGGAPRSRKSFVNIDSISTVVEQTNVRGRLRIDNFTNPHINAEVSVDGQLDGWNRFIFDDQHNRLSGHIRSTAMVAGNIDFSKKMNLPSFLRLNPKAVATLSGVSYTDGKKINLTEVSGVANLNGVAVKLSSTSGRLNGIKLETSLSLSNLLKAVAEPYPAMNIFGSLTVPDEIDYKQIEQLFAGGDGDSKYTYNVEIQLLASKLKYNKVVAERISGRLRYYDNVLEFNNLNFYSFGGRMGGTVNYRTGKNTSLFCRASVSDIDINQLFSDFDNFGQTDITSGNIEGILTSDFTLRLPFKADKPDTDNMHFDGHLNVYNGKLHDIEAISSIADFTKIDEFRNLEFSTLTNDITISNGVLDVPKMDVSCNACDISLYGRQNFNGNYEYHFKAVLSDFMRGKTKRLQQLNTPYGVVEEGSHTSIYLLASRTDGVTKIKFDRPEMKQQLRTEMQQQKQEVKQILKKEFGLFKRDTTVKVKEEKPQSGGFVIDWDADDDDDE